MTRLRLFVYGTLQPAARTRMGRWIARRLISAEAASAPGRIFAVESGDGWFPAFIAPKSARRVRGMLCEVRLKPGDLALLDRYEGGEYRRIAVPVRTGRGRRAIAQVYCWRIPLPRQARPIPSGDFLAWLREKRLSAFAAPHDSALAMGRSSH